MKKFFYRVEKGDCVLSVAGRFNVPPTSVIKLNALCGEIAEGDILYIEEIEGNVYTVQPFDTLESVGEKFKVPPEKISEVNGVDYLFYGLKIIIPD